MKCASRNSILILALLSFLPLSAFGIDKKDTSSSAAPGGGSPGGPMSIAQARKAVINGLKSALSTYKCGPSHYTLNIHFDTIRITAEKIEFTQDYSRSGTTADFDHRNEVDGFDLKTWQSLPIKKSGGKYFMGEKDWAASLFWSSAGEAEAFVSALNRLSAAARGEDVDENRAWMQDFRQKASTWRALLTKPPIPDEVDKHQVVAENAIREKDFDTAMAEYEEGLNIYPVWPEGHFNIALISAELGYYSEAIRHMQAYVELVPNAPDVKAVRDQIVIWQAKMKR